MKAIERPTGMDPEVKAKLQEVCDRVARGEEFSPEERKAAAARIDKLREANAAKLGVQNVAAFVLVFEAEHQELAPVPGDEG